MRIPIAAVLLASSAWLGAPSTTASPAPASPRMIGVSANGRYFVDGEGKPLFWQGDTEWELFHLFSAADAGALLRRRRDQGFNVFQVMVTGVYSEWDEMKGVKVPALSQAWRNNDPLAPDEDYFRRVDEIVAQAAKMRLILVIGVYHAVDQDKGRIGVENAQSWARWLAHRYRDASNIVWCMYPHAAEASAPVIRATVRGLREGDGGSHLITMHPDPSPTSSSFMHHEPWLSFNTLQTWSSGPSNYEMVAADYGKIPVKPVVDGEARYEGEDGTTPLETRRAGYWACLAGGFYSYGHRDNWMSPPTWEGWWDSPGAAQIKVLGGIFRSLDWWRLVPDPTIITEGAKGDAAARSSQGTWILAYLTGEGPATLDLRGITAASSAAVWWIDPRDGRRANGGSVAISGSHPFAPPRGRADSVLLLDGRPR